MTAAKDYSTARTVREWIAERDVGTVFTTHALAEQIGSTDGRVAAELSWVKRDGAVDHVGKSTWKTNERSRQAPDRVPRPPKKPADHRRPERPGIRQRRAPEYTAIGLVGALDCEACGHRRGTPAPKLTLAQRLLNLAVEVERLERLDPSLVSDLDLRRELKRRTDGQQGPGEGT